MGEQGRIQKSVTWDVDSQFLAEPNNDADLRFQLGGAAIQDTLHVAHRSRRHTFVDITDPFAPREMAHFVPPAPEKMVDPRPNRPRVIQSNDVYVAPDGLMYMTDVNDGLTILQYKG